jgi:hypothetical protein
MTTEDARAICEALRRLSVRFVAIKNETLVLIQPDMGAADAPFEADFEGDAEDARKLLVGCAAPKLNGASRPPVSS